MLHHTPIKLERETNMITDFLFRFTDDKRVSHVIIGV